MIIKYENNLTEEIIKSATNIASNAFRNKMSEEEVKEHLIGDSLYFLKSEDKIEGFVLFKHLNDILYLAGIAVKENMQKKGFFYNVLNKEISHNKFKYVALRTQSPVMYNAMMNLKETLFKKIFPSEEKPDKFVKESLKKIKYHLNMEGDSFINKGFYGKCLYKKEYTYKGKTIDKYLPLDSKNGDAVIVIGVL